MSKVVFNAATVGSVVVLILVVAASAVAGKVDTRTQFLSLSDGFHLSISARGTDARLHVFNDSHYGPYGGSIISLVGAPNQPTVTGFGDIAGIYYRMIRWPGGTRLWTLSLSLYYPLVLAAVLRFVWLFRALGTTATQPG